MLSFFRRALSSWVILGLLGLLMLAFIVTGVGTPNGLGIDAMGGSGDTIAKIGGDSLKSSEISRRAQSELRAARAQAKDGQSLDMARFVAEGGYDQTVNQTIAAHAMEMWARREGMTASDKLVDGEIGSIQAFQGPTGKFDRQAFDAVLQRERIGERELRSDISGDLIRRQLLVPVSGATKVPLSLVAPYAGLLLEARKGSIGVVPTQAMPAGTPPADGEINAYYARNLARYTIPERRIIRYATFGRDQLTKPAAKPTEAEIAAFYQANASTYAAKDTRSFSQVIVDTQAKAQAFAAEVRGGASFAAAAQKLGFSPADTALGEKTRAELTKLDSPEVAAAAFSAAAGKITDPVKSSLGWHVLRVDGITSVPGKTLEQARPEIAAALEKQKIDEALSSMVAAIEDAISGGSNFNDVVKQEKLTVTTTPALLADGRAPDAPTYQAPPELRVLLKPVFETSADEDPTVETIGAGQMYALLGVQQVLPAAPAPLLKVRAQVMADLLAERAFQRARAVATAIQAKVKAGTPIATAFAEAGMTLPAPQPAGGRQIDISRGQTPPPPPLALMFSMTQGDTKILAAAQNQGWFVIHLDQVQAGDVKEAPGLVEATRGQFTELLGREYAEQFSAAVEKELSVKRDPAAIARLKAQLAGGTAQ